MGIDLDECRRRMSREGTTPTLNAHAMRVTVENLGAVAYMTHGSVRGTKLPAAQRRVKFWQHGNEYEIDIGDTLVLVGKHLLVLTPAEATAAFGS